MADECPHENVEWEEGNYVPPYGWEISPGHYCIDCGEMVDPDEASYSTANDPDLDRKYELEDEMRNPL